MGDDLGTATGEVHGQAREVLDFWFEAVGPERHFAKDDALDAEIAKRFGPLQRGLLADEAAGWRGDRDTLLAAVIVLDQFSRNLFRGRAAAFAADPLALELTLIGIARGDDRALPPERRAFLYMPLIALLAAVFRGAREPQQPEIRARPCRGAGALWPLSVAQRGTRPGVDRCRGGVSQPT